MADDAGEATAPGRAPSRPRTAGEAQDRTRIVVLDDDPQMLRYLRSALTEAGYAAFVTGDPKELPELVRRQNPRLVLLDLVLPGTDGIELMQRIRGLADLPIIFISAYGRDETIAEALDAGAADYIVKPFSPSELTARVRAALRRTAEPEPFVMGQLTIHYDQRRVIVASQQVELTATEYELLRVLSMNAGRVLTYDSLLRQAWRGWSRSSRRPQAGAGAREAATRKTRRGRRNAHLHPQPTRSGLPHAGTGERLRIHERPAGWSWSSFIGRGA